MTLQMIASSQIFHLREFIPQITLNQTDMCSHWTKPPNKLLYFQKEYRRSPIRIPSEPHK